MYLGTRKQSRAFSQLSGLTFQQGARWKNRWRKSKPSSAPRIAPIGTCWSGCATALRRRWPDDPSSLGLVLDGNPSAGGPALVVGRSAPPDREPPMSRLHASAKPVELPLHRREQRHHKPLGLWYAIGNAWLDWCATEMPGWLARYRHFYDVRLRRNAKVLKLDTVAKVKAFAKRYPSRDRVLRAAGYIDWDHVIPEWDGIEVNPYYWRIRCPS